MESKDINCIETLQNWFYSLDYSWLDDISDFQLAIEISARIVFLRELSEAIEPDPSEVEDPYSDVDEFGSLDSYYEYKLELLKDFNINSKGLKAFQGFYISLINGSTFKHLTKEPNSLLSSWQLQQYWDEKATMPIKPYTVGDDLLWRRIRESITKIEGIKRGELDNVFPFIFEDTASFSRLKNEFIPISLKQYRAENPLQEKVLRLIRAPLDEQDLGSANSKYRNGQYRLTVDLNFTDEVLVHAFKEQLRQIRLSSKSLKPKNYSPNIKAKIISYKSLELFDLLIICRARKIDFRDIDLARIAFKDQHIDNNRFNQQIKPIFRNVREGKYDVTLMSSDRGKLLL